MSLALDGPNLESIIDDLKGDQSWCIFRIISEFTERFYKLVMFVRYSMGYVYMPGGFGTLGGFFEALTLMQTHKIFPMPLILFGVDFWSGLLEWIKTKLIAYATIGLGDLNYITLADDPQVVLDTMLAHREWKNKQRSLAQAGHNLDYRQN